MKIREWIAKNLDKVQEHDETRIKEIEKWAIDKPYEVARYLHYLETERLKGL